MRANSEEYMRGQRDTIQRFLDEIGRLGHELKYEAYDDDEDAIMSLLEDLLEKK